VRAWRALIEIVSLMVGIGIGGGFSHFGVAHDVTSIVTVTLEVYS